MDSTATEEMKERNQCYTNALSPFFLLLPCTCVFPICTYIFSLTPYFSINTLGACMSCGLLLGRGVLEREERGTQATERREESA
jgi:hypothetical protein